MLSALVQASSDGRSAIPLPSSSAQTTVMLEKGEKWRSDRPLSSFAGARAKIFPSANLEEIPASAAEHHVEETTCWRIRSAGRS